MATTTPASVIFCADVLELFIGSSTSQIDSGASAAAWERSGPAEQIRRMLEACRRIEFIVGVDEAQMREQGARGNVLWIVTGKKRFEFEHIECMPDDGRRGFEGIATPPVIRGNVHAEFRDARMSLSRPQPAAPDVSPVLKREDGPVLSPACVLSRDFSLETSANLRFGEAASRDEPRDGRV